MTNSSASLQARQSLSSNTAARGMLQPSNSNPFAELDGMNNETRQDWLRAISPTNLRYLTALRGFVPATFDQGYTYAMLECGTGQLLVALAAANPDGQFFGFGPDADKLAEGAAQAAACGVDNVKFVSATPAELAEALAGQFDYVVANLCAGKDSKAAEVVVKAASTLLREGGLCYTAYNTTQTDTKSVDAFLPTYQPGASNTDRVQSAARTVGLDFVGSAKLRNNYLELAAPSETHATLTAQQGAAVYENLKDVAGGLTVRHDVFTKPGLEQNAGEGARFGGFAFGLPTPAAMIEPQFHYFGKKMDLSTPLYARLISTLSDMPHTIGDLLADPAFEGTAQEELVSHVQLLVAAGIAEPVRAISNLPQGNFQHLLFAGDYNRRLRDEAVTEDGALLASTVLGRALLGSPPMVMTLQALDAGGLSGAEEILDGMLQNASAAVKAQIPADLNDKDTRRNTAYRLLEQSCKDWMLFCCTAGILEPATH